MIAAIVASAAFRGVLFHSLIPHPTGNKRVMDDLELADFTLASERVDPCSGRFEFVV